MLYFNLCSRIFLWKKLQLGLCWWGCQSNLTKARGHLLHVPLKAMGPIWFPLQLMVVEAHFFSPRWATSNISVIHQGSKKPASPVIHGKQNMKGNGPKAIHQAQAPKSLTESQTIYSSNSSPAHSPFKLKSAAQRNSEIIWKWEGEWPSSIIFPSSLGAVLEALKGDISKE